MNIIINFFKEYHAYTTLNIVALVFYAFGIIPFFIVVSILLISIVLLIGLMMLQNSINELKSLLKQLEHFENEL